MLTTPRLSLRPWLPHEAERLLDIRRRIEVARWLSSTEPWTESSMATEAIVEWAEKTAADDPFGTWAIIPMETGVPLGSIILYELPDSTEVHIGWYLHPDGVGNGYASEGATAVLEHGLAHGIPRIWAVMDPANQPSAKVAGAIGMTDLGELDDPWFGTADDPTSRMFRLDAPAISL